MTSDAYVYIIIKKGIYRLKQATILAYNNLKTHLLPHGYVPVLRTVGLWKHHMRPTKCCLCVDNFGITYYTNNDAQYLLDAIGKTFIYTTNWEGNNYCGKTLDWNYTDGYVDTPMADYVKRVLYRLQYTKKITTVLSTCTYSNNIYSKRYTTIYNITRYFSPSQIIGYQIYTIDCWEPFILW